MGADGTLYRSNRNVFAQRFHSLNDFEIHLINFPIIVERNSMIVCSYCAHVHCYGNRSRPPHGISIFRSSWCVVKDPGWINASDLALQRPKNVSFSVTNYFPAMNALAFSHRSIMRTLGWKSAKMLLINFATCCMRIVYRRMAISILLQIISLAICRRFFEAYSPLTQNYKELNFYWKIRW